jgi:hypothetical protein
LGFGFFGLGALGSGFGVWGLWSRVWGLRLGFMV